MVRCFAVILLALSLAGCSVPGAGGAPEPLYIEGLEFENRSSSPISSIQLLVPVTGNFVACGRIDPGARCAARFPDVAYSGHPIEVKWIQGNAEWSTGQTSPEISADVRAAGTAQVLVVVLAPGSAGVLLVPGQGADSVRTP